MDNSSLPSHYSGKYLGSFAYLTIKDRLPVILTKVIDTLCRERHSISNEYGELAKEETKEIVGCLSALQNEMMTNKPIKPLVSDSPDVNLWNEYLENQIKESNFIPSWYESSWLYVECYLYRRIKQAFELSTMLKNYDPFRKQKEEAFFMSINAMKLLAQTLQEVISEVNNNPDELLMNYFTTFLEISLWGNKCDLSISAGKENTQLNHNPLGLLDEMRKNILINDTKSIWEVLLRKNSDKENICVDIILDNAGFELFCDLCFLYFLQSTKLVKKCRFYVKEIPWFVSDTLYSDIVWLLDTLSKSNDKLLTHLSEEWKANFENHYWTIEKELFWTLPHDYSEMKATDSALYNKLSHSDLIIFKGDLNYRKLTGDRQWEETTSFHVSLNGFLPTNLVSLRTVKADVIVGLESGTTQNLDKVCANWKFSGDYAIIQYASKT